jgi:hypothetical protein
MLEQSFFDTEIVLESHTHEGPTAAIPIGYHWLWRNHPSFRRWGKAPLRLHLEVFKSAAYCIIVPHVEPDPAPDPLGHIKSVEDCSAIVGEEAVDVLRRLLGEA